MTLSAWNSRLKAERSALWSTQAAAADALGITRETMSRYESGLVKPGIDALARLAELGIDVLYVITGRREAKPTTLAALEPAERRHDRPSKARAPALSPPPTLAEPAPKWGVDGSQSDPVRSDTTRSGAPPVGGFTTAYRGGLLVSAASREGPPLRLPVEFDGGKVTREFQVIPRYRAAASAGKPGGPQEPDTMSVDAAGVLAMDRAFMRDQLGSDKPGFVSVAVKGDSMERTLIDGETIIIDSDVQEVDCNGIYVVQVGRALLVKRLVLGLDGSVVVKSDNPAYSSYDREFSPEQVKTLRVVGRMVWPKFR